MTFASTCHIVIPVSNKLFPGTLGRARRFVIGPERTADERRLSLAGGAVGAALADIFGVAWLVHGSLTNDFWRQFPPPLAPFVLLPLLAGALAGLRFTTDLVRPSRLTWQRLLAVTVGVVALSMVWLTTFGMYSMAFTNGWQNPAEIASNIVWALVLIPPMAAVWTIVPGLVLAPFLVPFVGAFAFIMRRLADAAGRIGRATA